MIAPKTAQRPRITPRFVRLDAATVCQLKCPSCPTASGETGRRLGKGFLTFADFRKFIRDNSEVSHIELSNWGEVFLNKDLPRILAHAYRHNVCLYVANGSNMNHLSDEMVEAVVKYKLRAITCSIDGASQEIYVKYRVNGDFDRVMKNIRRINRAKARYRSRYPEMLWQFVAFGHNEYEILKAKDLAKDLGMDFRLKLSWDDLYDLPNPSPVQNADLVARESGLGVSSRKEYLAKYGQDYAERPCCRDLWHAPQMNADGRMLGCPINFWGDYGNAFRDGLDAVVNGEGMTQAREMLLGRRDKVKGLPCSTCKVYEGMKRDNDWIMEEDVAPLYKVGRKYIMFENKILGAAGTRQLLRLVMWGSNVFWFFRNALKEGTLNARLLVSDGSVPLLPNRGYPLDLPLDTDDEKKWKPTFLFSGRTAGIGELTCHASSLNPGHSPHPPHKHRQEEILIMLDGEAELTLPYYAGGDLQENGRLRLRAGQGVYYPSFYPHTLKTSGAAPANYLMFKWAASGGGERGAPLSFRSFDLRAALEEEHFGKGGLRTRTVFEGPSDGLARLQAHTSILAPGAGYQPHRDAYDVAIVLLEGELETLGRRFAPHSVIFHPAGKPHGLVNPGTTPARYVVIEFQSA